MYTYTHMHICTYIHMLMQTQVGAAHMLTHIYVSPTQKTNTYISAKNTHVSAKTQ